MSEALLRRDQHATAVLTDSAAEITCSTGWRLDVQLLEVGPGHLRITSYPNSLAIMPRASNSFVVSPEADDEPIEIRKLLRQHDALLTAFNKGLYHKQIHALSVAQAAALCEISDPKLRTKFIADMASVFALLHQLAAAAKQLYGIDAGAAEDNHAAS